MGCHCYPCEEVDILRTMWVWTLVVLLVYVVWGGSAWPQYKVEKKAMCLDSLHPKVHTRYGLLRQRRDCFFSPGPGGGPGDEDSEEEGGEDEEQDSGNKSRYFGTKECRGMERYVLFASYDFQDTLNSTSSDGGEAGEDDSSREGENEEWRQKRETDEDQSGDLFSLDFSLSSSEVSVPGWWLCTAFRSGRKNSFLTVALVGGSILEESEEEAREEELRARYGEYVLLASRREGEEAQKRWRDDLQRASQGGAQEWEAEDVSETPVDESWAAIEELRELWRGGPVVKWSPSHTAGSHDSSSNTDTSNTDHLPIPDALHSMRGTREGETTTDEGECVSGLPPTPKPYTDYFSPSNISRSLLPGSLPAHHLTQHLRLPFASPWHTFRHTVDYHMRRTGILRYPNLAAATFRLSADSCPQERDSPSVSRFLPSSMYRRGRGSPWSAKTGVTVPVDITPVVHSWLRHMRPWQRRSTRLTLIMFLSDNHPSQQTHISSTTNITTHHHHQNRTQQEDEEEEKEEEEEEEPVHNSPDLLALNLLLRRDPPRLTFNYWMDESCRRRGGRESCEHNETDPTCLCRIRPWCMDDCGLQCDFERPGECDWEWQEEIPGDIPFSLTTGRRLKETISKQVPGKRLSGVLYDSKNNSDGQFLYLGVPENGELINHTRLIKSPWMEESVEDCRLEAEYNVKDEDTTTKVIIENGNYTRYFTINGVKTDKATAEWKRVSSTIGHLPKQFRLGIEVTMSQQRPTHAAIDNIRLVNCFESVPPGSPCMGMLCETGKCIDNDSFCDITRDCPGGEDESLCDPTPEGSRCDFENGWCGWRNVDGDNMDFNIARGPTNKERTGPGYDHTYQNDTGHYLLSELPTKGKLGDHGVLESPLFDAPPCYHSNTTSPYYESCKLRLYYHKLGRYQGSLIIKVIEYGERGTTRVGYPHILIQIHGDKGTEWVRELLPLPKGIYNKYRIQISNVRGQRFRGDLGIDDITLSPECFGRNVVPEALRCPAPPTIGSPSPGPSDTPTPYVRPEGVVMVTTCGAKGHEGPTSEMCREEYHNTPGQVATVPSSTSLPGTQMWIVPSTGYYTFVAKGASGGSGVQSQDMRTHGAISRATFFLQAETELYILVGQEGMSACRNVPNQTREQQTTCHSRKEPPIASNESKSNLENLKMKINSHTVGGGGGGGGASFVFMMENKNPKALVVGGGGSGLAWSVGEGVGHLQDGQGMNLSLPESHGHALHGGAPYYAGAGGGWERNKREREGNRREQEGQSLVNGGVGGRPCNYYPSVSTYGGFGGGGGGCLAGGGGGGYTGGNAYSGPDRHGEGGYSYTAKAAVFSDIRLGVHSGPGVVFIIPNLKGECGCDHICVPLDQRLREHKCLCDEDRILSDDGKTCIPASGDSYMQTLYAAFIMLGIIVIAVISATSIYCCHLIRHPCPPSSPRNTRPATVPMSGWFSKLSGRSDVTLVRYIPEELDHLH